MVKKNVGAHKEFAYGSDLWCTNFFTTYLPSNPKIFLKNLENTWFKRIRLIKNSPRHLRIIEFYLKTKYISVTYWEIFFLLPLVEGKQLGLLIRTGCAIPVEIQLNPNMLEPFDTAITLASIAVQPVTKMNSMFYLLILLQDGILKSKFYRNLTIPIFDTCICRYLLMSNIYLYIGIYRVKAALAQAF